MSQEQYVDMDRNNRHHHQTNSMSSAASSCSITSGTPSTDMRFAEYHLEKVTARFTPDDEEQRLVYFIWLIDVSLSQETIFLRTFCVSVCLWEFLIIFSEE